MKNPFENFFTKKEPLPKEDKAVDAKTSRIGQEYLDGIEKAGEKIQEEITADFYRVKSNWERALPMKELIEETIRENPEDLYQEMELGIFMEMLRELCSQKGKYRSTKTEENIRRFLADTNAYKQTHSDQVNDEMPIKDFMNFLQKLGDEANQFLGPKK